MLIFFSTLFNKGCEWFLNYHFLALNINLLNRKTLGFHPKPWKFFEKNLVKLLVKCNFIAFFINPCAIFLKSSPWWGRCHEVTDEGKNNVKIIKIYPSSASPTAQHLLPREGFKTLPSSYACHLPFQGRLSSWEGSHERGAVTQWLRGYDSGPINLYSTVLKNNSLNLIKLCKHDL